MPVSSKVILPEIQVPTPPMPKTALEAENLYYYYLHEADQECLYKEATPVWVSNFRDNLSYIKKGYNDLSSVWEKKSDSAIIFCAGPSHKNVDVDVLKRFNGDIIGTNKTLKFLFNHGIKPSCIVALDAAPVMIKGFKFHHAEDAIKGQKFYFGTVLDPVSVKYVLDRGGEVYWGNPEMPGIDNATDILEIMVPVGYMRHGGNAGCMGLWLAYSLGYKNIGMVGMDLGTAPSTKWSPEEARLHKYYWIPWMNKTVAVSPVFRVYLGEFARMVMDIAYPKEGEPSFVQNLTRGSLLELVSAWPTRSLEEFVNDPNTTYSYFGGARPSE